jgi:RNA polymerase sigma-70 factor (ECF subfamily)
MVRTGDPTEAEDLTQDVMIRMIGTLDGYEGRAGFATWLYSVTRNAAVDRLRRDRRRRRWVEDPAVAEALAPAGAPEAHAALERIELSTALRAFFMELPLRQREVLDLV